MKSIIRKEALKIIKSNNKELASTNVIEAILKSKTLDNYNNIGIYYPIRNEIDITKLTSIYPDKNFYLPKTTDVLQFIKYDSNTILAKGPFNTLEPVGEIINRDDIECFIIPCVGITKFNQRLGYGKGYYDRYLEGYKGLKIGVCYKNVDNLDIDYYDHDIILDIKYCG